MTTYKHEMTYYTHFNGGRPYKVVFTEGEGVGVVNIYKKTYGEPDGPSIKQLNVSNSFIGKSKGDDTFINADHCTGDTTLFDGNTILLETGKNSYTLIGDKIVEFDTEEPITNFWACVGRNDIPYPVALSENFIYFLQSSCMTYVPIDIYEETAIDEGETIEDYEFAYFIYYQSQKLQDEAFDLTTL